MAIVREQIWSMTRDDLTRLYVEAVTTPSGQTGAVLVMQPETGYERRIGLRSEEIGPVVAALLEAM